LAEVFKAVHLGISKVDSSMNEAVVTKPYFKAEK